MHILDQLTLWWAQLEQPSGEAIQEVVEKEPQSSPFGLTFLLPMMLALVVMMMLMRPRKTDTKLKERLKELKKNDRVLTAGGILGTVVAIREDTNYVTLRIDESTNTKMQVVRSSIVKIVDNDEKKAE